jgi:hypothetical protein
MRLSPRERRILATIEDEFERDDAALAVAFAETRFPSLSAGWATAGSGVLTAALILPWLISASRANATAPPRFRRRRAQDARRARDVNAD